MALVGDANISDSNLFLLLEQRYNRHSHEEEDDGDAIEVIDYTIRNVNS